MKPAPFHLSVFYFIGFTIYSSHIFGLNIDNRNDINEDSLDVPEACVNYETMYNHEYFENLKIKYGNRKIIPEIIAQQALVALSHYPELVDTRIEFVIKKAPLAHISRPSFINLILPKEKRIYLVIISNEVNEGQEASLHSNLDFNAQVGVLGHELAHTTYYQEKNLKEILWDGIRYFFDNFRVEFERETDISAIEHNLGYQLFHWSQSVHKTLEENDRGHHYLKPYEILEMMKSYPIYQLNNVAAN